MSCLLTQQQPKNQFSPSPNAPHTCAESRHCMEPGRCCTSGIIQYKYPRSILHFFFSFSSILIFTTFHKYIHIHRLNLKKPTSPRNDPSILRNISNPSLSRTEKSFFSTTNNKQTHTPHTIPTMTEPVNTSSSPNQGSATTSSNTPATAVNGQEPERPAPTENDEHPELDDFVKGFYDGMLIFYIMTSDREGKMFDSLPFFLSFIFSFMATRWWILGCRQPCLGHLDLTSIGLRPQC